MDKQKSWKPEMGETFKNGEIWNELVAFVPDENVNCFPPFIKGKRDCCWVKYREGKRPETKKEWENKVGLKLQTML